MAKPALAALESALRARKLDGTMTPAGRSAVAAQLDRACTPTTVPQLDECLGGGLPRGQLCELAGAPSSGRTTVLLRLLAGVTQRGDLAALVDTTDSLDVAAAADAGIDLQRLLWIRGSSPAQLARSDGDAFALERAIKALNLVLQAGGFSIVAIDLADVPVALLKRLPLTTWLRLQRAIEGRETTCVLVVPEPLARSAGGLTIALTGEMTWNAPSRLCRLRGVQVTARVQSPRRYANGETRFFTGELEPVVHRSAS
jgi:hypothetical protein